MWLTIEKGKKNILTEFKEGMCSVDIRPLVIFTVRHRL